MLDKLLNKVTRVDSEAIRDIYINVLAMVTAQERASNVHITRMVSTSAQSKLPSDNFGIWVFVEQIET